MFAIVNQPIDPESARSKFTNLGAGGLVVFEGRVRNVNEGRPVNALEYEVFHELCRSEAELIIREAKERFSVIDIFACHREGYLVLGDVAVWIGVSARHRDDAFKACRYVIDEIKHRLPIWKRSIMSMAHLSGLIVRGAPPGFRFQRMIFMCVSPVCLNLPMVVRLA